MYPNCLWISYERAGSASNLQVLQGSTLLPTFGHSVLYWPLSCVVFALRFPRCILSLLDAYLIFFVTFFEYNIM